MSLPNLRQALGENFLDSDSGYEDYTSDSDYGSENILEKSCGEDVSDMPDEDFPVRRKKRFTGKNGVELRKIQLKANQAEKGKIHLEYVLTYIQIPSQQRKCLSRFLSVCFLK